MQQGHHCSFAISLTGDHNSLDLQSLRADELLADIISLASQHSWFTDRLGACKTPVEYQHELQSIVNSIILKSPGKINIIGDTKPSSATRICKDLADIGYDRLVNVDTDLSTCVLRCDDKHGRSHLFQLSFPGSYPDEKPIISASLPSIVQYSWDSRISSLSDIFDAVHREIIKNETIIEVIYSKIKFKVGFNLCLLIEQVLSNIDESCRVVEPLKPTFAISQRRIAVDKYCSVTITLNPIDPKLVQLYNTNLFGIEIKFDILLDM